MRWRARLWPTALPRPRTGPSPWHTPPGSPCGWAGPCSRRRDGPARPLDTLGLVLLTGRRRPPRRMSEGSPVTLAHELFREQARAKFGDGESVLSDLVDVGATFRHTGRGPHRGDRPTGQALLAEILPCRGDLIRREQLLDLGQRGQGRLAASFPHHVDLMPLEESYASALGSDDHVGASPVTLRGLMAAPRASLASWCRGSSASLARCPGSSLPDSRRQPQ